MHSIYSRPFGLETSEQVAEALELGMALRLGQHHINLHIMRCQGDKLEIVTRDGRRFVVRVEETT